MMKASIKASRQLEKTQRHIKKIQRTTPLIPITTKSEIKPTYNNVTSQDITMIPLIGKIKFSKKANTSTVVEIHCKNDERTLCLIILSDDDLEEYCDKLIQGYTYTISLISHDVSLTNETTMTKEKEINITTLKEIKSATTSIINYISSTNPPNINKSLPSSIMKFLYYEIPNMTQFHPKIRKNEDVSDRTVIITAIICIIVIALMLSIAIIVTWSEQRIIETNNQITHSDISLESIYQNDIIMIDSITEPNVSDTVRVTYV